MKSIWCKNPAESFKDAFPLGNGRLGAKIYGTPGHEIIQLNEESIWSGTYENRNNPSAGKELKNIKKLLELSRYEEAQELVYESFTSMPENQTFYESAGNLEIDFYDEEHYGLQGPDSARKNVFESFINYKRELDMENGICSTVFSTESGVASKADFSHSNKTSITYTREAFISAEQDVLIIRITASTPKSIYMRAKFKRNKVSKKYSLSEDTIAMQCIDGIPFTAMATAIPYGGKTYVRGDNLIIEKADEVILYVDVETAYRKRNYKNSGGNVFKRRVSLGMWSSDYALKKICNASGAEYSRLKNEHCEYFSNLFNQQKLTLQQENKSNVSLEDLITDSKYELECNEMLWNFCKYSYLSSCMKPGTLPSLPNGLWYTGEESMDERRYTLDSHQNVYLPGLMMGFDSFDECILKFAKRSLSKGRKTAEILYGTAGYASHSKTDIWGDTAPSGSDLRTSYKVMGGVALGKFIGEFFEYSQNKKLVKKYWKFLKAACEFYINHLQFVDDKKYITLTPSYSDGFQHKNGQKSYIGTNNFQDNEDIKTLFKHGIETARILNISENDSFMIQLKQVYAKIKVEEKSAEPENLKPELKNIASLYGNNSRIFAYLTDCVVSSKITDNRSEIILLPSLPENWKSGSLTGINLKGNILIDISWDNGSLKSANVYTQDGKNFLEEITVTYKDKKYNSKLIDGALDLLNVLPTTVSV